MAELDYRIGRYSGDFGLLLPSSCLMEFVFALLVKVLVKPFPVGLESFECCLRILRVTSRKQKMIDRGRNVEGSTVVNPPQWHHRSSFLLTARPHKKEDTHGGSFTAELILGASLFLLGAVAQFDLSITSCLARETWPRFLW